VEPNGFRDKSDQLSHQVIGAAMDVYRVLGPGLLESAYEECFCRELYLRRIPFQRQVPLPLEYKGIHLDCAYRMDVVIDGIIIVEIKSVTRVE
jgi:GxxExxY protein